MSLIPRKKKGSEIGFERLMRVTRFGQRVRKPRDKPLLNAVFGGEKFDELFVNGGEKVYERQTKVPGARSFQPPIQPAAPRL